MIKFILGGLIEIKIGKSLIGKKIRSYINIKKYQKKYSKRKNI